MEPLFFSLIFVLLFSGCCENASCPERITPTCFNQMWEPLSQEGRPIPECAVVDPMAPYEVEEAGLGDLLMVALQNNPETKISWSETRIKAAEYGQKLQPYFPEVEFDAYFMALRQSLYLASNNLSKFISVDNLEVDEYTNYGPYFSLSYLIFDFGTTRAEAEAAKQLVFEANWYHNQSIQHLVKRVTLNYYNYLTEVEKVLAAEANQLDAAVLYDSAEKKFESGVDDVSDVLIAKTQMAKVDISFLKDVKRRDNSKADLVATLGIPANREVVIKQEFEVSEDLPEAVEEYLVQAFLSRPELFASYSRWKSQASSLRQAKRDPLPKLQLNADGGRSYFDEGLSDGNEYKVELNLQVPLFKGYWYQNKILEERYRLQKAQEEFYALEMEVIREVVVAHQNYLNAIENLRVNRDYLESAALSYRATLAQFQAGTVDITTVVNAFNDLASARYSMVDAKKEWFDAVTNLSYATGVLCFGC